MSETGSGKQLMRGHSFAMERMMAKDEEDRLDRVNTKQKRGTPTVSYRCNRGAEGCLLFVKRVIPDWC